MDDKSKTKLNIYYQNVRGLRSKTYTFYRNLCQWSFYDVIVLTETWLLDSVSDSESRGGGVLIAVRKDIQVTPQATYHSSAEDIWITISLRHKNRPPMSIHICSVYLCKQNLGFSFTEQLQFFLLQLNNIVLANPSGKFIVLGDFNLSNID